MRYIQLQRQPVLRGVITFVMLLTVLLSLQACTTAPEHSTFKPVLARALPGTLPDSNTPQNTKDGDPVNQWFLEARNLVSKQFDVDLSNVNAFIADADKIQQQARHSLIGALSHDIQSHEFAESLVENMLEAQTASVLAIYSPRNKAILMHRGNLDSYLNSKQGHVTRKASVQALLIHELIHAVDDIRFEAFDHYGVSYQEVFAKSTIVEGHAQWHTRRLCQKAGCGDAFNAMTHYMFDVETQSDPALQYIQNRNFKNLEFVYREGERFIDQLMQRPGGEQLVKLAFEKPPRDSIQIIDPSSFPNRKRESRNLALSTAIKRSAKPWNDNAKGLLRRNVLAAAAFSVNPEAREPIVDFYTSKIHAAAKHEYYDKQSDIAIPVSVIALETSDNATAQQTAELIFGSTARTYNGLSGDMVTLNNWQTDQHSANIQDKELGEVKIELFTANGAMINDMVGSNYPVEVVTAVSGNFIVHIDGRFKGTQELMQFAGQLLLNLRRS